MAAKKVVRKKVVGKQSTLTANLADGTSVEQKGKIQAFSGEPAIVTVGIGSVINMGNYQSLRLSVQLAYPCDPKKVGVTFDAVSKFAAKKLDLLITEHKAKQGMASEVSEVDEVGEGLV